MVFQKASYSEVSIGIERKITVKKYAIVGVGGRSKMFLDALLEYWKTVSSLVQRQEHGAQREKENLIWADGRRDVCQTLLVMYEVDKALSRGNST